MPVSKKEECKNGQLDCLPLATAAQDYCDETNPSQGFSNTDCKPQHSPEQRECKSKEKEAGLDIASIEADQYNEANAPRHIAEPFDKWAVGIVFAGVIPESKTVVKTMPPFTDWASCVVFNGLDDITTKETEPNQDTDSLGRAPADVHADAPREEPLTYSQITAASQVNKRDFEALVGAAAARAPLPPAEIPDFQRHAMGRSIGDLDVDLGDPSLPLPCSNIDLMGKSVGDTELSYHEGNSSVLPECKGATNSEPGNSNKCLTERSSCDLESSHNANTSSLPSKTMEEIEPQHRDAFKTELANVAERESDVNETQYLLPQQREQTTQPMPVSKKEECKNGQLDCLPLATAAQDYCDEPNPSQGFSNTDCKPQHSPEQRECKSKEKEAGLDIASIEADEYNEANAPRHIAEPFDKWAVGIVFAGVIPESKTVVKTMPPFTDWASCVVFNGLDDITNKETEPNQDTDR